MKHFVAQPTLDRAAGFRFLREAAAKRAVPVWREPRRFSTKATIRL
ncbi:hypothetical protein [Consotaella aegiceratis]